MKIAFLLGCLMGWTVLVSTDAFAQRTKVDLQPASKTLTQQDIANMHSCKLVYRLKAGMTYAEAGDAIDTAFDRFAKCLNANALKSIRQSKGG